MARLPYVEPEIEETEKIRKARGRLIDLDRILLHSPNMASAWRMLMDSLRGGSSVPPDMRELASLRVGYLNHANFQWRGHRKIGKDVGLSEYAIQAAKDGPRDELTDDQRTVLEYAEQMTRQIDVKEETWEKVRKIFNPQQCVELAGVIAAYNMATRMLVAFNIGEQNGVPIE